MDVNVLSGVIAKVVGIVAMLAFVIYIIYVLQPFFPMISDKFKGLKVKKEKPKDPDWVELSDIKPK